MIRRDSFSLLRDTMRWRVALVLGSLIVVLMVVLGITNVRLGLQDTALLAWIVMGVSALAVGGLLMLLPGFLGDLIGLLCLLPGTRGLVRAAIAKLVVGRLPVALRLARRARRIAWQSVAAGMGLSLAAMAAAAAGWLSPLAGAILQEAIDVAVILNALRVLLGDR